MASLRFDDDLKKSLIPAGQSISNIDAVTFEEIIQTALKDYLSKHKVTSEFDFRKSKSTNEDNLGLFTKCVFQAIFNKLAKI